jgi:hypothetical protein
VTVLITCVTVLITCVTVQITCVTALMACIDTRGSRRRRMMDMQLGFGMVLARAQGRHPCDCQDECVAVGQVRCEHLGNKGHATRVATEGCGD